MYCLITADVDALICPILFHRCFIFMIDKLIKCLFLCQSLSFSQYGCNAYVIITITIVDFSDYLFPVFLYITVIVIDFSFFFLLLEKSYILLFMQLHGAM